MIEGDAAHLLTTDAVSKDEIGCQSIAVALEGEYIVAAVVGRTVQVVGEDTFDKNLVM